MDVRTRLDRNEFAVFETQVPMPNLSGQNDRYYDLQKNGYVDAAGIRLEESRNEGDVGRSQTLLVAREMPGQ